MTPGPPLGDHLEESRRGGSFLHGSVRGDGCQLVIPSRCPGVLRGTAVSPDLELGGVSGTWGGTVSGRARRARSGGRGRAPSEKRSTVV